MINSFKEPFATQWQIKGETAEFEQYDDFEAVELGGFVWTFGKFIYHLTRCTTLQTYHLNSIIYTA